MKTPFEHPLPESYKYTVYPHEVEAFVSEISDEPTLSVDTYTQYPGTTAYALTLTDPDTASDQKKSLFVSRPHAHEPAGTAAIIELTKALTGHGIYATLDPEWRTEILRNFVITLMPDANPMGSHRAPVKFWDGSQIANEQFFLWMFGESGETKGERFPRLATWDMREVTPPALLGIAYEQIDEHTYVEPNRDYRSTFFKSFFELDKKYNYDVWLDLHQTEFLNSDYNAEVHLATCHDDLSPHLQQAHQSLGEALHQRWQDAGANPVPAPKVPYRTNTTQRDFLTKVWLPISSRMVHLVTEVQNNNPKTPTPHQVYFQDVALMETLQCMSSN